MTAPPQDPDYKRGVYGVHPAHPELPTPAFLAVIHMASPAHAAEQTLLAIANGADGVFLINHHDDHGLFGRAVLMVREVSDCWLGINALDLDAVSASRFVVDLNRSGRVDGLWTDNAQIDEASNSQPAAVEILAAQALWSGQYFGGVAFKYQRPVEDLEAAAEVASRWMDYVCTSGPGTGKPADPEKLRRMASTGARIAVASGVDVNNLAAQLPHVGAVLVASSISSSRTDLDPHLVRGLAEAVRAHRAQTG